MINIEPTTRHGLQVYRATICVPGRLFRESMHMSEQGARNWVRSTLQQLVAQQAA